LSPADLGIVSRRFAQTYSRLTGSKSAHRKTAQAINSAQISAICGKKHSENMRDLREEFLRSAGNNLLDQREIRWMWEIFAFLTF
jgi:hypothetical protein